MSSSALISLSPLRERWLLITLAGIQFSHILDFMILMPLGPHLTHLFAITDAQFGLLVSAYTLAGGVSGVLAATYIDRFDRKRLLLFVYILFALATAACGMAWSYSALLLARIAAGAFGGLLSTLSQTIVGDVIPFERRGRAMGVVMTSFSLSTVLGVPLGLYSASYFSWNAPFIGIAVLSLLFVPLAFACLPRLTSHLHTRVGLSAWQRIRETLTQRNHLRAFLFSSLIMFTGFTIIPYITIYMQANVGMRPDQMPLIYLCGGVATLFTARWFGRLTDFAGEFETFRALAVAVTLPMLVITLLARVNLVVVLGVTTAFFICMSGRMIPAMAMLTSAAQPHLRGTFMTLNAAIQSAAMGLAAFAGGHLISRTPQGLIENYWLCALVGGASSLLAIHVARRLNLHPTA